MAGGSIRILRDEHDDYLSQRVGANHQATGLSKFVASGILGVFAATTTLVALSYFVEVFVAKLVSILVGFAANFSMSHFIVFRPKIADRQRAIP